MRFRCDRPGLAGEIWFDGADTTQVAADPTCLLRAVKHARAAGETIRAAYVPDAELGTRWFADKALWVRDGDTYLPFITHAAVDRYLATDPTATIVDYDTAVNEVRP